MMLKSVEYKIEVAPDIGGDAPIEVDFETDSVWIRNDVDKITLTAKQFDEIAHARQVFLRLEQDAEEADFPTSQQIDGK